MRKGRNITNRMTLGRGIVYVLVSLIGLIMLYPMWYVLCVSFSNNLALAGKSLIFWPQSFDLSAYAYVLLAPMHMC